MTKRPVKLAQGGRRSKIISVNHETDAEELATVTASELCSGFSIGWLYGSRSRSVVGEATALVEQFAPDSCHFPIEDGSKRFKLMWYPSSDGPPLVSLWGQ